MCTVEPEKIGSPRRPLKIVRTFEAHRKARQPCQGRHEGGVDTSRECHHTLAAPEPDRLADSSLQVHDRISGINISDCITIAGNFSRRPGARDDPEPVSGSAVVPLERELTSECGCCKRVGTDTEEGLFRR
ncbi:MAG: hypothetical protein A4E36_00568 [Methanoregulaceae archaeon PtaB.Bin009]|nr:MAG: hypothetical protein A4E36_00568 [Methanoregulaceae archaeon PtaB.Bin009]